MKVKKKKKTGIVLVIILIVIIVSIVISLGFKMKKDTKNSPVEITKNFMDKFNKLDKDVISNIKYDFKDPLNERQKKEYTKVIRRQYEKLGYSIISDDKSDTEANIKVEVNIFDYNTCWNEAGDYIDLYSYKFANEEKKVDYKISKISKCHEKITHIIMFKYTKKDDKWIMNNLDEDDIRKINGTY